MTFVVPQFDQLFRESAAELPLLTRLVLAASGFLNAYGWLLVVAALALWLLARRRWRRADARVNWDRSLLRWPLVGPLVAKAEVERFARALAALLASGVEVPAALGLAADVVGNGAMRATIGEAIVAVRAGERLARALAAGGTIPPLALQLIRVGEEGGRLEEMLTRLADAFAADVDIALKRLVGLVEPALILLIGLFVGLVVLSLLSAIVGVNALAL